MAICFDGSTDCVCFGGEDLRVDYILSLSVCDRVGVPCTFSRYCGAPAIARKTGISHASGIATNHRKMFKSVPSDLPSIGSRKMIPSRTRKPNRSSLANGLASAFGGNARGDAAPV